jgi:hypothetical protein
VTHLTETKIKYHKNNLTVVSTSDIWSLEVRGIGQPQEIRAKERKQNLGLRVSWI